MIVLGLARIARLLEHSQRPWRAIHVAGTNGKGSICSYISAMLQVHGVRTGRFTSPHLIDRWDCISINGSSVDESLFREVEEAVKSRNMANDIGATQFELLTATAFEIFTREKVDLGVVECGLGGRLDATNIFEKPLVTIISKIGLDHQKFLGNTVQEIAREKAGIMKPGVPCVVDDTNEELVKDVLESCARQVDAKLVMAKLDFENQLAWKDVQALDLEDHQQTNLSCAIVALKLALEETGTLFNVKDSITAIREVNWPARLQKISVKSLTGRTEEILLDGAHNAQSATVLGSYVDRRLRRPGQNVTWVIAASHGKDIKDILRPLLKPGDNVAAVKFGLVDNMPWVAPTPAETIFKASEEVVGCSKGAPYACFDSVIEALQWANEVSRDQPVVVAGSLYLASDVMRLLRDADAPK